VSPKALMLRDGLRPTLAVEAPNDQPSMCGKMDHHRAPPIPAITIETEDADTALDYGHYVPMYPGKRLDHNSRADFERPPPQNHLQPYKIEVTRVTKGSSSSAPEPPPSLGAMSWTGYIYEPVIIALLRCQLDVQRLGILLSRDATGGGDGLVSRLHYPSLVALDGLEHFQLATVMKYARISTRVRQPLQWRPWEAKPWPEIRISSTITSCYALLPSVGQNWTLDDKGSVLTPKSLYPTQHGANTTELAPLALLEYMGSSSEWWVETDVSMFFLSIPICELETLVCEVGVLQGRHTPMSPLNFQVYSCNLASARHARVPLSHRKSMITLKYREGAGLSSANVSIRAWASNVGPGHLYLPALACMQRLNRSLTCLSVLISLGNTSSSNPMASSTMNEWNVSVRGLRSFVTICPKS